MENIVQVTQRAQNFIKMRLGLDTYIAGRNLDYLVNHNRFKLFNNGVDLGYISNRTDPKLVIWEQGEMIDIINACIPKPKIFKKKAYFAFSLGERAIRIRMFVSWVKDKYVYPESSFEFKTPKRLLLPIKTYKKGKFSLQIPSKPDKLIKHWKGQK